MRSGEILWTNPNYAPFPEAHGRLSCDYLIVGGGISGVMTAYLLAKQNAGKIVLVEKDQIGSGATGTSAGMILREFEGANLEQLVQAFGPKATRAYWDAHTDMYEDLKRIVTQENIECELHEGDVYIVAKDAGESRDVQADTNVRKKLGITSQMVSSGELRKDINLSGYQIAERVQTALSVNPVKLVQGLARAARTHGAMLYENSPVLSVGEGIAHVAGAEIRYGTVIMMTDSYDVQSPVEKFRTSIAVTNQLSEEEMRELKLEDFDMFIESSLRGYHYMKVTHDRRILIGFGDELVSIGDKLHQPISEHVRDMEHFVASVFVGLPLRFEYLWTGTYGLAKNLIPHLSLTKSKVVMGGAGLQLTSMVMARYVVDKLRKKSNKLDVLYKS